MNEAECSRSEAVPASAPVEFCGCTGSADALAPSQGRVQAQAAERVDRRAGVVRGHHVVAARSQTEHVFL